MKFDTIYNFRHPKNPNNLEIIFLLLGNKFNKIIPSFFAEFQGAKFVWTKSETKGNFSFMQKKYVIRRPKFSCPGFFPKPCKDARQNLQPTELFISFLQIPFSFLYKRKSKIYFYK